MKKFTKVLLLFSFLLLSLAIVPAEASASDATTDTSTETVKNGLLKENGSYRYYNNGKLTTSKWKTVDGYKYYFDKNGNAVTLAQKIDGTRYVFDQKGRLKQPSKSKVVTIGSDKYYVSKKGKAKSGWVVQSGKLYYAKASGKCLKSTTYRDIKFTKNSYAKTSDYATKAKIKAMEIVKKITNSSMTKKQKLRKCFDYTLSGKFVGSDYPTGWPNMNNKWFYKSGYKAMTKRKGNCYGAASMFALLARELGYKATILDCRIPGEHCIVKINGKYYDNMYGRTFASTNKRYKSYKIKGKWTLKP